MIDSATETLVSLADAARTLPRRRRGRAVHVSCIYRWTTTGLRGVVLESLQVGGSRCTSQEALQRFFMRLSEPRQVGTVVNRRTPAQRQRAVERAGRELAERGA
jgi:hypothetical protein